ncbi:hypothetical protein NA56DRAFT_705128 [Hyaloscypha hepaticicola]|uniref:Uncharacterized protein n=1 Tax=Hyaloscypha hepaticicola TaxID=2082293 RepID=A0A2J6Q123_9HELO|nr:hypothetical protein NA56DRAFT_705128 [Hyaloscypha hepaticicola]
MNGSQIKQAAIQKAKQVANVSNGNANKKRKKELKPIITTDGPDKDAEAASNMAPSNQPAAGTITNHLHVCHVHAHAVHSLIPAIKMNQADLLHILYIHLHNVFAAEEPADHQ